MPRTRIIKKRDVRTLPLFERLLAIQAPVFADFKAAIQPHQDWLLEVQQKKQEILNTEEFQGNVSEPLVLVPKTPKRKTSRRMKRGKRQDSVASNVSREKIKEAITRLSIAGDAPPPTTASADTTLPPVTEVQPAEEEPPEENEKQPAATMPPKPVTPQPPATRTRTRARAKLDYMASTISSDLKSPMKAVMCSRGATPPVELVSPARVASQSKKAIGSVLSSAKKAALVDRVAAPPPTGLPPPSRAVLQQKTPSSPKKAEMSEKVATPLTALPPLSRIVSQPKTGTGSALSSAKTGAGRFTPLSSSLYRLKMKTTNKYTPTKKRPAEAQKLVDEKAEMARLVTEQKEADVLRRKEEQLKQKAEQQKRKREENERRVRKKREEQMRREAEKNAIAKQKRLDVERHQEKQKTVVTVCSSPVVHPKSPNPKKRQHEKEEETKAKGGEKAKAQSPSPPKKRQQEGGDEATQLDTEQQKAPPTRSKSRTPHDRRPQDDDVEPKKQQVVAKKASTSKATKHTHESDGATKETTRNRETYEMTPLRALKPSSSTNYDITDLNSGDETDDEDNPRKNIPFWASGAQLKASLIQQHYTNTDTKTLFGDVVAPQLETIFTHQRKRFHKRTSSAIWDSPLAKAPAPPPHPGTQK